VVLGDFNGDGITDILVVTPSSGATVYLSTGTGYHAAAIPSSSTWSGYTVVAGDWNGDGKTDIALIGKTAGQSSPVYLSNGTGFSAGTGFELEATIPSSEAGSTATVADWNNDGAADLWLSNSSGDTEFTFSYVPELMTSVSNGIGATTSVIYDRLNHGTIYTKGFR
jgi:membrane-bound lytic murein transglycosylase B